MSLRDGGSTESPLIGRYCGVVLPSSHLSRGNQLLIRFKTDHSVGHDGFRASYKTGKIQRAKKWKNIAINYVCKVERLPQRLVAPLIFFLNFFSLPTP